MDSLINFDEPDEPQSLPGHAIINKVFGVISRDCFATDVTGMDDNGGEELKPGTLIQIIPDYRGEGCHFMIRDFPNWLDKYKSTIYKCLKDDYIVVTIELWPYLLSLPKDKSRIKFVQNVYSRKFNLGLFKLGSNIRIHRSGATDVKYYEFVVTHIGVVKELGTGYYIGLRLKNDLESLPSEHKKMSLYYRFGGTGIVVSADWIMQNLYKEITHETFITPNNDFSTINKIKSKELNKKIVSNSRKFSSGKLESEIKGSGEDLVFNKNSQKENLSIDPNAIKCPNKICKNFWINPRNSHKNYERCPKCNTNWCYICSNSHEPGDRHGSEVGKSKTEDNNKRVNTYVSSVQRSSSSIEKPKPETGAIPKTHRRSHETLCEDVIVGNSMKVQCGLCAKRIEIGCEVLLGQCLHSFCRQCITGYIEENSKKSQIRCPYNKEYVCKFNLMRSEISNLGGELLFEKIIDNRLKESMGADPDARVCSNKNCKFIWMSTQNEHANNERCPKCKTSWCFICSSAHEPGERHGKISDHTRIVKESAVTIVEACAKCHKSIIPVSEYDTLQKCKHRFCNDCIWPMVKARMSGAQCIQCTVCQNQNQLEKYEVAEITGCEMLKSFFDNQENELERVNSVELCCCRHPTVNCFFVFKCKHKFCRTLLMSILQEQLQSISRVACPSCFEEIDDYQIKRLVNQMKAGGERPAINGNNNTSTNIIECLKCEDKFEERFINNCSKCRNSICLKCAKSSILGQFANNRPPSCSVCQVLFDETQIETIINANITIHRSQNNSINESSSSLQPVEIPFECIMCEQPANQTSQIVLTKCKHEICRKCLNEQISVQKGWPQIPKCPSCKEQIDRIQLDALGFSAINKVTDKPKQTNRESSTEIFEKDSCSVCYEKLRQKIALKNCGHEFCRRCVQANITVQQSNRTTPSCPLCRKSIEPNEITKIKALPQMVNADVIQMIRETPLRLNNRPFNCTICLQDIGAECGIILTNCRHSLCRDCLSNIILQQSASNLAPKCPMCQIQITDEEVRSLDSAIHDIFVENRLIRGSEFDRHEMNRHHDSNIDETFFCVICEETFDDMRSSQALQFCNDRFCRPCITTAINDQILINKMPTCPLCSSGVCGTDIINLCGSEAYRRIGSGLNLFNNIN